jgi:hypothetical protein
MSKLMKKITLASAILGGMMFHLPTCSGGGQFRWLWAILQEDIFG